MLCKRDGLWETGSMEPSFGRGVNLQFSTKQIDILISKLEAAKIPLYEPKIEKWRNVGGHKIGCVEFLVQDPDGYLLRFIQQLPE